MIMRIAILEDEQIHRDNLVLLTESCFRQMNEQCEITCFETVEAIEEALEKPDNGFSLMMLDIDVNGKNGLDVAIKAQRNGFKGVICFVTSHTEYTREAFLVEAIGYIEKPVKYENLYSILNKAYIITGYKFEQEEIKKKVLEFKSGGRTHRILLDTVLYMEKVRNKLVIYTERGVFTCYESFKQVYERLNQNKFVYCHEGIVVNFDKVVSLSDEIVLIADSCELPMSRKCARQLGKMFDDRLQMYAKEKGTTAPRYFDNL